MTQEFCHISNLEEMPSMANLINPSPYVYTVEVYSLDYRDPGKSE